jgi:hypothetical protein
LALTYCARAGPLLAPISCLAGAITPRAPSADRLRGAIGATQNTLQSLSCRGQYGCSVVKGVPPAPDCPCIALASCLARAAHGLTDPHVHVRRQRLNFSDSRSFLLQWGAGLLAGARRAACLQLSCCAPGSSPAYNHCAGWMGLCPSSPAQGAPPPARPACAAARVRAPALPVPARHGPSLAPLSHNQQHLCAQIRAGLDESF